MEKDLIYDVGMHTGQDTAHYLQQGFRVLAIEADPVLVERARIKFKSAIEKTRLTILNVGIGASEGMLPFYRNHRLTEWSSFDKELGTRNGTTCDVIEVRATTMDKVIKEFGTPFYLKIDIEGFDERCVEQLDANAELPAYISCEASDIRSLDLLKEKGYTKFKIISQSNSFRPLNVKQEANPLFYQGQIIKNGIKLRLQKIFPFAHPYGSAGPFAENTKGSWLPYKEAREQFRFFSTGKKGKPLNGVSWFDFHATVG
jgi:FkbM family methyltransferase